MSDLQSVFTPFRPANPVAIYHRLRDGFLGKQNIQLSTHQTCPPRSSIFTLAWPVGKCCLIHVYPSVRPEDQNSGDDMTASQGWESESGDNKLELAVDIDKVEDAK